MKTLFGSFHPTLERSSVISIAFFASREGELKFGLYASNCHFKLDIVSARISQK